MLRDAERVIVIGVSGIIENPAVGPGQQSDYLNGVCHLETTLTARGLLDTLLSIERACGRRREAASRWGPRTLDLDLLLYGESVINEPGLTVPHPRMAKRLFVLGPLAELAPDLAVPGLGATVADLLREATAASARGVSS